ncbi:MAG: T9SS type A sorting domain-containing protein [Chitinophagales bacterium]
MKKASLFYIIISWFAILPSSAQNVEWKDVAGIFYNNCATCHRPGEIGDGYIDATSYAALVNDSLSPYFFAIPARVNERLMPPWKANPDYHHFLDERILSDDEITLIDSFVAQVERPGYDPGEITLAPPPPVFAEGSQLGIPDTVLTMAQAFPVPGDYTDHYQCFVLHTNLLDSRNVKAIEFRAGDPKIVHHVFIYTCIDGSADSLDATTPEYGYPSFGGAGEGVNADFLTLYGPGLTPRFYPEGSGIKFKANTALIIQIHYAPTDHEVFDQSSLNIFYEPESEIRIVKGKRVGENYVLEPVFFILKDKVLTFHSEYTLDSTYSMFSIAPHMHYLGQEFKIWAVTPGGDSVPLCHIPVWDFKWQLLYNFPCFMILPQGTVVHSEATYDNTTNNPNNPNNPPKNVGYGESSYDEMDKYFMNLLTYQSGDETVVFDSALCALDDYNVSTPFVSGMITTPQLYNIIPNPANDQAVIDYYLPKYSAGNIVIYDLLGRTIPGINTEFETTPGFHRSVIDTKKINSGIYFLVMQADGKRITKRLVVEH